MIEHDDEALAICQKAGEACLDNLQNKLLKDYSEMELKFSGTANGACIRLKILVTKVGPRLDELKAVVEDLEENISYPELHLSVDEIAI